jgi:hypothetical protein
MSAAEFLDFDVLVRKHVRIVPTCRYFQLSSWVLASLVLFYLILFAFAVFVDFGHFAVLNIHPTAQNPPTLDFMFSRTVIDTIRSGWISPTQRTLHLFGLFLGWTLSVFVALSMISLQFDRFVLAALSVLALLFVRSDVVGFVDDGQKWHGAMDINLGGIVEDIWTTSAVAYFWLFALLTLRQLYTMSAPERNILREGATNIRFSGSTLLHVFGIPSNIRNSARRVRTALLAFLANLIGIGPVVLFLVAGGLLFMLFWAVAGPFFIGWYDPDPARSGFPAPPYLPHFLTILLVLLVLLLMAAGFRMVGNAGLRMSRRFMRVSLEQAQAVDQRRPVLFLRSFSDDAVVLAAPPSGFIYKLFGYVDRKKSLDELLLEEGTPFGPVVALGNPTDAVPPYGAARGYAKHSEWQKMVSDLMDAAVAIVICVDETPSLWWEIEHVSRNEYLTKTLLLLHPKYAADDSAFKIIRKIEQVFELSVPGVGSGLGQIFGLWLDPIQGLRVGLASRFSRAHYLLMLRWFLRSRTKAA